MPTEEGKELAKPTIDGHKKKGDHKDNGNAPLKTLHKAGAILHRHHCEGGNVKQPEENKEL